MKKIIVALALLLALLLGVCVFLEQHPQVLNPTEPATYQVTFSALGKTLSTQTVTENALPQSFSPELPGVRFLGWADANGSTVDPFSTAVTGDVSYVGIAYPELTNHAPFLFADSEGKLNPDGPLTADDFAEALYALAAPGAEESFPSLPTGSSALSRETVIQLLGYFFETDAVSAAFAGDSEFTRSVFAQGLLVLLERSADETVSLAENALIPADVTAGRADAVLLLEAAVPHTPDSAGILWQNVELVTGLKPGFVNLEGWLYYIKEDGYMLRDADLGMLHFGADGRYTTGDLELDQIVADLLNRFIQENPEATRFELLRVAYDYCHQTFGYRRSWDDHPAKGSHGWEVQRAKDIFTSGKGNCYGFAAAFWALARGLGYEARAISGVVLSDEQPHSWCFIEFDGKDYIFDPQWQFDYTRRGIYEHDMFFLPTDDLYFWGYQWFED